MCDSDDTDILLLIPPDFFLSTTLSDERLNDSFVEEKYHHNSNMSASKWEPLAATSSAATDANFNHFLPTAQQIELANINARLSNIETNFSPPSDLSTISNSTHCRGGEKRTAPRTNIITHSTPKDHLLERRRGESEDYHGVLKEIDHFLEDRKYHSAWLPNGANALRDHQIEQTASLPAVLNRLPEDAAFDEALPTLPPLQENLVSLSEMWSKNAPGNLTLKEEQYRRLHLEKTIRTLQNRLLECQQKISVALEVDKSKDKALRNAQIENNNLHQELKRLKETSTKAESDLNSLTGKYEIVQKELAKTLGLAAKLQDKNEKLENEVKDCSRKTTENSNLFKKKIDELEIMVHSCKKSEEYSASELAKMKDRLVKAEHRADKASIRCEEIETQMETHKNYKEQAQELMQKHKNRADSLEEQKKTLNEKLTSLTEKEVTLQKKLESQRQSLKLHYQQQLEIVVAQKLKEFQSQLDKVEETLKQEGRDRERLIAERAMKQMELINEKNEQELNLLQEKHYEEVELYRIQQANASKKIAELESKLSSYKTKRADIAEKLHSVMEVQWQKALEILTSPNAPYSQGVNHKSSASTENIQSTAENEQFETPKSSRQNGTTEDHPQMDRLQAYIELLLSKSPEDIENLNELLSKSKGSTSASKNKNQQRLANNCKPPWKG